MSRMACFFVRVTIFNVYMSIGAHVPCHKFSLIIAGCTRLLLPCFFLRFVWFGPCLKNIYLYSRCPPIHRQRKHKHWKCHRLLTKLVSKIYFCKHWLCRHIRDEQTRQKFEIQFTPKFTTPQPQIDVCIRSCKTTHISTHPQIHTSIHMLWNTHRAMSQYQIFNRLSLSRFWIVCSVFHLSVSEYSVIACIAMYDVWWRQWDRESLTTVRWGCIVCSLGISGFFVVVLVLVFYAIFRLIAIQCFCTKGRIFKI